MRLIAWLKNYKMYSKTLVSIMWPSVCSWAEHCVPTGHQCQCQTRLSAQGSLSQHIDQNMSTPKMNSISLSSKASSQTNTLKPWFYFFLHPPKIMYVKHMECSYFPLSLRLSVYYQNGQVIFYFSWSRKNCVQRNTPLFLIFTAFQTTALLLKSSFPGVK